MKDYFRKRFERFLLDEGIEKASLLALLGVTSKGNNRNLEEHLDNCNPANYISSMGAWVATEEGQQFWGEKSKKWENIVKATPLTSAIRTEVSKNKDEYKSIW